MLLFLVRHAHASSGEPDSTRPLSERGRAEALALATTLATHDTRPAIVFTSPLLRARETADAIAAATGTGLRVDERLAPGASLETLRDVIEAEPGPVVVVCHQPDCSEIALAATGRDPGFPPGGMAEIRLEP